MSAVLLSRCMFDCDSDDAVESVLRLFLCKLNIDCDIDVLANQNTPGF
jgi:hypothetical protein